MAKPNAKAPLGQGGRFAAVEQAAARSGARNPAAVAAAAGRAKYGAQKMASMAAKGRSHHSPGRGDGFDADSFRGVNASEWMGKQQPERGGQVGKIPEASRMKRV